MGNLMICIRLPSLSGKRRLSNDRRIVGRMKSYAGIIIAFLVGVFAVSAGWGGAIYAVLLLIGLLTIVVLSALVLTHLDKRKPEENQQSKAASEEPGRIEDGTWTLNLGINAMVCGQHGSSVRPSSIHASSARALFWGKVLR